jgi:hypothetical protein
VRAWAHATAPPGGSPSTQEQLIASHGFGPFRATVTADASTLSVGHSLATQDSVIGTTLLHASGVTTASARRGVTTSAQTNSTCRYLVEFDLFAQTPIALTGLLQASGEHTNWIGGITAATSVYLISESMPTIYFFAGLPTQLTTPFSDVRTIGPGHYILLVEAITEADSGSSAPGEGSASASFDISLIVIPAPAMSSALALFAAVLTSRRKRRAD